MSSTSTIIFPSFQRTLATGPYDWVGDNLHVALLSSAPHLGDETFRDVARREVKGNGYKPGGKQLRNKRVQLFGGVWHCHADTVRWRTRRLSARHAVVYRNNADRPLLVWVDFGRKESAWERNDGKANMAIEWDPRGVMALDHECCIKFPHEMQP